MINIIKIKGNEMHTEMGKTSKIEQVYLYVIKNSQSNINFGKTLFFKILYFSDFDFYERCEKSITNDVYFRIPFGPAPTSFDKIISNLKAKGLVKEFRVNKNGHTQIRYIPLKEFKSDKLNLEEKAEIDQVISRLSGMSATQVSAYSHQDMPFKATDDGKEIDYELVFYRNPIFSVRQESPDEIEN